MPTLSNNELTLTIKAIDNASSVLKKVKGEVDDTTDSTSRMGEGFSKLGGLVKSATVALAATGAAALTAGTFIGFNFNSSVEQAQAKLMAFMKDGNKVAETLAWVKDEAAKTQFSFTEMADAAANLTPVSKSTGVALQDLIKQAEILAALNPAEGLTGATFSLREALSGDWVSIVDRFNLPRKRINELKAEGVPAMEIITRTLQEMGIEYDLVAKQGQTVGARFDQVKDKLTMMAGAAAKPIFDRVSKELEKLGDFDFQKLGTDMSGWVQGALDLYDELVPKIQAVWQQVSDYLSPKLGELWKIVSTDLIPALQKFWREVIEPMLPVIGVLLVGALGLVVDAVNLLLPVISGLVTFLSENEWVFWAIVTVLGAIKAAMVFDAVVAALTGAVGLIGPAFTAMSVVANSAIASVKLAFTGLSTLIATPLVFPAIVIAAALAALAILQEKAEETKRVIDSTIKAQNDAQVTSDQFYARNREVQNDPNASPELKARWKQAVKNVAKNATGTNYFAGGWSMVGEQGPEMAYLPPGSKVMTANQSRDSAPVGRGSAIENMTVNVYNQADEDRLIRAISMRLRLS